jgi:cytochrome c oxidase subunit 2
MTVLLSIAVVALVGLAIWQLTKIFQLSQMKSEPTQIADDKDNQNNGYLMFAFLVFIYGLTFFSFYNYGKFLLPAASSEHGAEYDNLMLVSFVIIFLVMAITQVLLHYFAFKYRGKAGQKALYFADNNKLELIWTSIPVVVLTGLILWGLYTWNDIMNPKEGEDPIVIELYAQQFNWTARYAGADNVLGDANVRLIDIDNANILGVDTQDPNAADDIVVKELHLPVGQKVLFKMRSQDVLHSAYMPHFRAQMNCVPGMITEFAFTPTETTAEMRQRPETIEKVKRTNALRAQRAAQGIPNNDTWEFDYVLLCNKICGKSHYNMQMKIVVDTPEDYQKWLAQQTTFGASMEKDTTATTEVEAQPTIE